MNMSMEIALNKCNNKQLIFIIDKLYLSLSSICESVKNVLKKVSVILIVKMQLKIFVNILNVLNDFQWHSDYFVNFIRCQMGEISVKELRKAMGLETEEENNQKCIVCDCDVGGNLKVCKCASEYKF